MRQFINYPEKQEDWNNFPQEFSDYLTQLDTIRVEQATKNTNQDPLYPNYDYTWELDEDLAFQTILLYWNDVENELPDPITILDEINDCYAENAYDEYNSSFYSC